jgi:hypothetical protein
MLSTNNQWGNVMKKHLVLLAVIAIALSSMSVPTDAMMGIVVLMGLCIIAALIIMPAVVFVCDLFYRITLLPLEAKMSSKNKRVFRFLFAVPSLSKAPQKRVVR